MCVCDCREVLHKANDICQLESAGAKALLRAYRLNSGPTECDDIHMI